MQFSEAQKLITHMLCDIHEALSIKDSVDPAFIREALSTGNTWALGWEYPGIFGDEQKPDAVLRQVGDFLNMWEWIERSHAELSSGDKAKVEREADPFGKDVTFRGFDGNNETDHLSVARFLIEKMDRWNTFNGRDLNSHCPSVGGYARMLEKFEATGVLTSGRDLTADQLIAVLKERIHPDNR